MAVGGGYCAGSDIVAMLYAVLYLPETVRKPPIFHSVGKNSR